MTLGFSEATTEVATASFSGGKGMDFFMSPTGYDKNSSVAPCAAWMIRAIPDDAKTEAMLIPNTVDKDMKFTLACQGVQMLRRCVIVTSGDHACVSLRVCVAFKPSNKVW